MQGILRMAFHFAAQDMSYTGYFIQDILHMASHFAAQDRYTGRFKGIL